MQLLILLAMHLSVQLKNILFYTLMFIMIRECLNKILGQMWEELTAQVIHFSHFYIFIM